jgi:hypothetical protein
LTSRRPQIAFAILLKFRYSEKATKRGCVIGNTEIVKRGDSPVFDLFSFGPSYEMKKIKVV